MALRVMLDTMIFDRIVGEPGLADDLVTLITSGDLDIMTTHVQRDELEQIDDPGKRKAVTDIPCRIVPTAVFVLGVSRLGQARLGDDEIGGVRYDDIYREPKHTRDAVIALTAASDADVLVTEDRRLSKRVRAHGTTIQVWDFGRFLTYVVSLKAGGCR